MADWFETRFREPVGAGQVDPAFAARVRALVVEEWQADMGSTRSEHTDADDHEEDLIMLETKDHPRPGAEPPSPRTPSRGRWLLAAAAVAVLALLGALIAAAGDDDEGDLDTVTSVPTTVPGPRDMQLEEPAFSRVEPGMYFIDPDGDPSTSMRVVYQIAAEGWSNWLGAAKFNDDGHLGISIATVTNLPKHACTDHTPLDPPVGPTVDDFVTALTQLEPFEVTSAPRDVTVFGYQGKHVALRLADVPFTGSLDNRTWTGCDGDGSIRTWISPLIGDGFSGYTHPLYPEEFWILDVEGTRLMIQTNHSPNRSPEDLAELQAIFDSIRIEL